MIEEYEIHNAENDETIQFTREGSNRIIVWEQEQVGDRWVVVGDIRDNNITCSESFKSACIDWYIENGEH